MVNVHNRNSQLHVQCTWKTNVHRFIVVRNISYHCQQNNLTSRRYIWDDTNEPTSCTKLN